MSEIKHTLLVALDICETALALADHHCEDSPGEGERCGECLGCLNWAAWTSARAALAKAIGREVTR